MQEPVAVGVDRGPVAVRPDTREAPPVGVEVALGVAPDAARHAGPRLGADELADLAAQRPSAPGRRRPSPCRGAAARACTACAADTGGEPRNAAATSVPPRDVHDRPRPAADARRRATATARGSRARRSSRTCRSAREIERRRRAHRRTAAARARASARRPGRSGGGARRAATRGRRPGSRARRRRAAPSAPRPWALASSHGPHDPADVGHPVTAVARLEVALCSGPRSRS